MDSGTAFTGTSGNDTFNAPAVTLTALDSIDGGAGTGDVLNVSSTIAYVQPAGITVKNIETVNFVLAAGGPVNTTSASGFTGVTALNITSVAAASATADATTAISATTSAPAGSTVITGGSNVTVTNTGVTFTSDTIAVGTTVATPTVATTAPTGAVVISSTGALATAGADKTAGAISVVGGTTISVTEAITNAATTSTAISGAVGITGTALTTAVTVNQAATVGVAAAIANVANTSNIVAAKGGVTAGGVTIADLNAANSTTATVSTLAGTITAVTLNNYGTTTISSAALNTLTLSGTGASVTTLEGGSTAVTNKTLTLNLGGGTQGLIADSSAQFSTINSVLTAATTITTLTDTALRTLALSGTGVLTLTNMNTAVTALTATGAAGLNTDLSGTAGVTTFTAANTTGAMTLTLNAATQAFTGGTGRDIITIGASATKVITGGSGATDRLNLSATAATYLAATQTNVTGFEQLYVTNVGGGTYDMSVWTGFNAIGVNVASSTNTFTKVASGTSLNLESGTTAVVYQSVLGVTSVAVNLVGTTVTAANGGGTAGFTTTALTLQDINTGGIATVTVNSDASVFQGLHTIATLTDVGLSTLAITGTGSLSITNQTNASSSMTISDNGTGASATADGIGTLIASGNTLGSISYSGTHAFTIGALADNVANLSITNANTGTTGVLTVAHNADANLASLTLTGAVAYTLASSSSGAAVTVSGATDNQNVSLTFAGAGVKTVTLGNGANTVVGGSAADVITLGTGANDVNAGAGADKVTFGAHTAADTYRILAAAGAGGGDSATFAVPGTNTISTTTMDKVTGLQLGDKIQFTATAGLYTGVANAPLGLVANGTSYTDVSAVVLTSNAIEIVKDTYSSVANTFVGSATGTDSLVVYDSDAVVGTTAYESIVLVGYVAGTVTGIGGAAGLVTLG